jgi:Chaperone of endosialidase
MANAWYPLYKQNLLAGTTGYDLDNDTTTDGPYCSLVDTGTYTYGATHTVYNGSPAAGTDVESAKQGTDQRITAPTVANGTFDGGDLTFTSVTGNSIEALVIYRHNSGADTTWPLVLYLDTSVTGLPVTPNGGNITVTWNASGISTISDMRLKTDACQVGKMGPLPVYEYSYIWETERRRVGFMAQDVEKIAPDAVIPIGEYKAVLYDRAVETALRGQYGNGSGDRVDCWAA